MRAAAMLRMDVAALDRPQMILSCFFAHTGPRMCLLSSNSFFRAAVNWACSASICSCEGWSLCFTAAARKTAQHLGVILTHPSGHDVHVTTLLPTC